METYSLSTLAEQDVRRLYRYGIESFGLQKADSYFDGLFGQFDAIARTPEMYPMINEVRPGYRRCVYGFHAVYYRVIDGRVRILRVLGSENPEGLP